MKMMITGSEGLVGKALTKALLLRDEVDIIYGVNRQIGNTPETVHQTKKPDKLHRVYTYLENDAFVRELFRRVKPDLIFHLASTQAKDHQGFIDNVSVTNNLLKYCPQDCRIVYASSSTVYGNLSSRLSNSDFYSDYMCREFCKTEPTNLYGASKVSGESLIQCSISAGKITGIILRPCAIIGSESSRGAIPDIIKKIRGDSPELELFGDSPGSSKPYLHIEDMVGALLHFGFSDLSNEVYNICPADYLSIERIAILIMEKMDIGKTIKWLGETSLPIGDNKLVWMDNKKALKAGWSMKYPTSADAIKAVEKILGE